MDKRINDIKDRIARLKQEHAEAVMTLAKKKKETESLAAGIEKYNDNPKLKQQMANVIKQRAQEMKALVRRLEEMAQESQEIKREMKKTFSALKSQEKKRRLVEKLAAKQPLVIAASEASENALSQALSEVEAPPAKEIMPAAKAEKIEKKEEIKISKPVKKAPSKDLYDQAASEAKAQEEFLKKQSSRSYGNI